MFLFLNAYGIKIFYFGKGDLCSRNNGKKLYYSKDKKKRDIYGTMTIALGFKPTF